MGIRKVVAATMVSLAMGAGTVMAVAGPAQAAPDCYIIKNIQHASNTIFAESNVYCESTMQETPRYIEIMRQGAGGAWITLASGMGYISYNCVGTATTTYYTNGSDLPRDRVRTVTAPCG
jgi:hypothetical protein